LEAQPIATLRLQLGFPVSPTPSSPSSIAFVSVNGSAHEEFWEG